MSEKKTMTYYPGCSSQLKASASNYLVSTNSMCDKLDIKLTEIPDWNCCGASVGYCEGGELPRIAINARNFAQAGSFRPSSAARRAISDVSRGIVIASRPPAASGRRPAIAVSLPR